MIAPNYAAKRSELAKSIGLGHLRRNKAGQRAAVITDEKSAAPGEGAKPKRGRPAKIKPSEKDLNASGRRSMNAVPAAEPKRAFLAVRRTVSCEL